jgi:hypothetical protein
LEAALELAGKQELFDGKANMEAQVLGSISGRGISAKAGNNLEVIAESSANLTSFGNAGIGDNGSSQALSSSIDLAMLRQWVMRNSIKQGVWSGDLGSKLDPPRKEARISFVPPRPIVRFTNQLFTANDGICDIFINRSIVANSPRALVFGDSLARGLVPMMTRIFGMVLFCRSRYVHDEIVLGFKPQLVISQNAERYLSKVSLDDERLPFLLYPSLRTEPVAVPSLFAKLMSICMAVDRPPFYRFIEQIQEGISIDSISF